MNIVTGPAQKLDKSSWRIFVPRIGFFIAVYTLLTWFNLSFLAIKLPYFTLWLPSGLLVIALVLSPPWHRLVYTALALAINGFGAAYFQLDPRLSLAFTLGSVVEAAFVAWLLQDLTRRFPQRENLWQNTVVLSAAAVMGSLVNTGVAALTLIGSVALGDFFSNWPVWWLGHFLGLVITPAFCFQWFLPAQPGRYTLRQVGELAATLLGLLALLVILSLNHSHGNHGTVFLVFPLILWLGVRFGQRGASAGGLVLFLEEAWFITQAHRPDLLAGQLRFDMILPMQAYTGLVVLTGMGLAAFLEIQRHVLQAEAEVEARESLRELELFYRTIFETSIDGLAVYDPKTLRAIKYNDQTCRMLGYTQDEFSQLHIYDYEANDTPIEIHGRIRQMEIEGGAVFDSLFRRKDGSLFNVNVRSRRVSIANKVYLVSVLRDITAEKQAEQERLENELVTRALLDAIPDLAVMVDLDGTILAANQRSTTRRPMQDLIGANVFDYAPPGLDTIARDEIEETIRSGLPLTHIFEINGKYTEHQVRPIFNPEGKVVRLAMLDRDITEWVKAESELKRWKEVFYNSKLAMSFSFGSSYQLDEVNPAFAELFGYSIAEITGMPISYLYPVENRKIAHEITDRINRDGHFIFEIDCIRKDGSAFPVEVAATAVKDENGVALYRIAAVQDISARKRAEAERYENERRFRTIFEHAGSGIALVDLEGHILDANPAYAQILGYTQEELKQLTIDAISDPASQQEDLRLSRKMIEGEHDSFQIEKRLIRKDGSFLDVHLFSSIVRDESAKPHFGIGIIEDNSERKRTLEMLHFQAHLLDVVSQAIITTDLAGNITYWNRAAEELYLWKATETIGTDFKALFGSQLSAQDKIDRIHWLTSGGSWSGEMTMQRRDGSTFIGQIDEMPILDAAGRLVGIISVTQDITARRNADDALRKSNFMREILSGSLMNTPLALVFWKVEKGCIEIIDWNPAAENIFGWMREEAIGRNLFKFLPASPAGDLTEKAIQMLDHGQYPNTLEMDCRKRSGDAVLVNWFNTPLTDLENESIYVLSLGENISERRHAEDQVRTSLAEKEILLREVYHRVKNNLMVMISLIDLQAASINDKITRTILKDLQARVRTMAMVHQSLYQSPSLNQVDFEGYLITLISYLSSLYASARSIKMTYEIENVVLPIEMAIPCGLIINELVSNAYKYAFNSGQKQPGEECLIYVGFRNMGEYYLLEVSDNGVGLPVDLEINNAQSLGLQLVRLLTSQIDGRIEVEREQGTLIRITFNERRSYS